MVLRGALWTLIVVALPAAWAETGGGFLGLRKKEPAGADLPLEKLDERQRQLAKHVLDKPAFIAKGASETFFCKPEQYQYILDHPDRAVLAWRKLGAKCVTIAAKGDQLFVWADDQGSEVTWETIHRGKEIQIWFAEGKVRPGALMPLVPLKALVVMLHKEQRNADGATLVQHQANLYVQTDSKTAAMMTRLLGPASQRVAEQGMGQLQLFFSGLSWYLDRHPEQADELLKSEE